MFKRRGQTLVWGDALFDRRFAGTTVPLLLDRARREVGGTTTRIEAWFSTAPRWWIDLLGRIGFASEPEPSRLAPAYTIFDRRFSVDFFENNHYYTMGDSDLF